jgi:hypothetical protein
MAQKTAWNAAALTESDINTYLMHEGGAWTSYSPTWTQSATITHTVNYSKYARAGRLITWVFDLSATSAGTASNGLAVTPPVTAASAFGVSGSGRFFDTSASDVYLLEITGFSTTLFTFYGDASTASSFGGAPAVTVASGDNLRGCVIYEAAS